MEKVNLERAKNLINLPGFELEEIELSEFSCISICLKSHFHIVGFDNHQKKKIIKISPLI